MLQLTAKGGQNFATYNYPTSGNNGRINSMVDANSQTVSYTYDTLNRLVTASGSGFANGNGTVPAWSETYTYDGFGNLIDKSGSSSPPLSTTATNNQLANRSYDKNGNDISAGTYDFENRLVTASGDAYSYGPDNLRVWKIRSNGSQDVYFYDPAGRKIAVYQVSKPTNFQTYCICGSITTEWFAGEILNTDRLGSTTPTFPYGEPYQAPLSDSDYYATYYWDSTTGLDYAKNRYYSNTLGRFLSPDPYVASVGLADPGSWNRYTYTRNDPVNRYDPYGLDDCNPDDPENPCLPPPVGITTGIGRVPDKGGPRTCQAGFELDAHGHCVPLGLLGAMNLLNNPDCAKAVGADNSQDAISKLMNTIPQESPLGELQYTQTTADNGSSMTAAAAGSPPLGYATQTDPQSITLNSWGDYWTNPTNAQVLINGNQSTFNLVANLAGQDGVSGLTITQYQELIILHELKHLFGGSHPGNTPSAIKAYDMAINQDCLGLKAN